jgi:hypothetical protein
MIDFKTAFSGVFTAFKGFILQKINAIETGNQIIGILDFESQLPTDVSSFQNGDYFEIEELDISKPNYGGRAYLIENSWQIVPDSMREADGETITFRDSDGALKVSDGITNKLLGIAENANNYVLPTATSSILGGVKITTGNGLNNTSGAVSLSTATTSAAGSMSSTDKTKLDGVATGANNYVLPTATSSVLGGVKITTGNGLNNTSGAVSMSTATTSSAGSMSATDKTKLDNLLQYIVSWSISADTPNGEYEFFIGAWKTSNSQITMTGNGSGSVASYAWNIEQGYNIGTLSTTNIKLYNYSAGLGGGLDYASLKVCGTSNNFVAYKLVINYQKTGYAVNGSVKILLSLVANYTQSEPISTLSEQGYLPILNFMVYPNQLGVTKKFDGVSFNGGDDVSHFGVCSTAAATVEKTVAIKWFNLVAGAECTVTFSVTNTAAYPSLNVNATGAKPIFYRAAAVSAGKLYANRTYRLVYNGTQYLIVGDFDTTYSVMTVDNGVAGTATTANLISPLNLKQVINSLAPVDKIAGYSDNITQDVLYLLGTRGGLNVYRILKTGSIQNTAVTYMETRISMNGNVSVYATEILRAEGYWTTGNGSTGPAYRFAVGHSKFGAFSPLSLNYSSYVTIPSPGNSPVILYTFIDANNSVGTYLVDLVFTSAEILTQ